ncbi:hypothetical protein PMAYCL1PPCAC_03586, partial [Pristionchus mayeri]
GKTCLMLLAFFCPPLAVGVHIGCECDLCINFLLTFLLWLPGVIHAWYVILAKQRPHHHDDHH